MLIVTEGPEELENAISRLGCQELMRNATAAGRNPMERGKVGNWAKYHRQCALGCRKCKSSASASADADTAGKYPNAIIWLGA